MCPNPKQTAINLISAVEETLVSLGNEAGVSNNPIFETAINEMTVTVTAIQNWTPGNVGQDAVQVINVLESAVTTLSQTVPSLAPYVNEINLILAGIAAVVGVITANSAAPAPTETTTATPEESKAMFQAHVVADTSAKVQALVPGFKRSIWHTPESQYKKAWNEAVDADKLPDTLKVAA
jgi:hypothetical protein